MNLNPYNTTDYENISNWTLGENKPNSNPIKPNLRKAKMNINSLITKDYRKKDDFAVRKNKPNSNPISVKPKMSANAFSQKDYENKTALRPQKNKANSNPISNAHKPIKGAERKKVRNFFWLSVARKDIIQCSRKKIHACPRMS